MTPAGRRNLLMALMHQQPQWLAYVLREDETITASFELFGSTVTFTSPKEELQQAQTLYALLGLDDNDRFKQWLMRAILADSLA